MRRLISCSTSASGTLVLDPRRELGHELASHLGVGFVFRLVLQILSNLRGQRLERVELPEVTREFVIEVRQHANANRLDGNAVRHVGPSELFDRVVVGEVDGELVRGVHV